MMSAGSSFPSPTPSWESVRDSSNYSRKPMEDLGDVKDSNNSKPKQRQHGSDILMPSPPWQTTPISSPHLTGKEADSGKWVDKVMINKQNGVCRDEIPSGKQWDKVGQSPEMSPQRYPSDPAKIYPEQPVNKVFVNKNDSQDHEMNRSRYEATTTDESDDQAAASDSSEPDLLWQLNVPKATNIPNMMGSKLKRPSPRHAKSPEIRSSIPQPSPRRLSNGAGSPMHKTGRHPVSVEGIYFLAFL